MAMSGAEQTAENLALVRIPTNFAAGNLATGRLNIPQPNTPDGYEAVASQHAPMAATQGKLFLTGGVRMYAVDLDYGFGDDDKITSIPWLTSLTACAH